MADVPNHVDLMWPTVLGLRGLGGVARNQQIDDAVLALAAVPEELLEVEAGDRNSRLSRSLRWSRTHLRKIGVIDSSESGVWHLTSRGESINYDEMRRRHSAWRAETDPRRRDGGENVEEAVADEEESAAEAIDRWRDALTEALLAMPPDRFEHLARRLLLSAGFVETKVLGGRGDGGIDGVGIYRPSLVSFLVYFQCKRQRKPVNPEAVRAFRGAIARLGGERGLFITTARFTPDARAEALNHTPTIDPIDGDDLCDLLRRYNLGVDVEEERVERVSVDPGFFADF